MLIWIVSISSFVDYPVELIRLRRAGYAKNFVAALGKRGGNRITDHSPDAQNQCSHDLGLSGWKQIRKASKSMSGVARYSAE